MTIFHQITRMLRKFSSKKRIRWRFLYSMFIKFQASFLHHTFVALFTLTFLLSSFLTRNNYRDILANTRHQHSATLWHQYPLSPISPCSGAKSTGGNFARGSQDYENEVKFLSPIYGEMICLHVYI